MSFVCEICGNDGDKKRATHVVKILFPRHYDRGGGELHCCDDDTRDGKELKVYVCADHHPYDGKYKAKARADIEILSRYHGEPLSIKVEKL